MELPGIAQNSHESLEDEVINTQGNAELAKTIAGYKGLDYLNTSKLIHSKLGLIDNQMSINYDLGLPLGVNDTGLSFNKKLRGKDKFAQKYNFKVMPQEMLEREIDVDTNVDLEKTMWLVIRNKKSVNSFLKKFETKNQFHKLQVNDIIKFGRVNFKVSIIKSDKLNQSI